MFDNIHHVFRNRTNVIHFRISIHVAYIWWLSTTFQFECDCDRMRVKSVTSNDRVFMNYANQIHNMDAEARNSMHLSTYLVIYYH